MFAKFFSLYFFLGSCLPGTNFGEITRLPDLVQHYQLHVDQAALLDVDYTLFNFINDHFINPDEHTQSGHENDHQDLPLHSVSTTLLICGDIDLQIIQSLEMNCANPQLLKLGFFYDYSGEFFHPPSK